MSDRWALAQKYEREEWSKDSDRILSQNFINTKKIYSDNILNWLMKSKNITKESQILQIGSAGEGEIFFFEIGNRYAIDPLADFYYKQFGKIQDENVRFIKGVGEALPWQDEFFDVIILFNVLDHVKSPSEVLSEIRRVLKKGGIAYIAVHTYSWSGILIRNIREILHIINPSIKADIGHPFSFSAYGLEKMIVKHFDIIDTGHDTRINFENLKISIKIKKYINSQKMYRYIVKKNG